MASCTKTPTSTQSSADMLRAGNRWKLSSGTVEFKAPYNHYWSTDSVMFGITKLFTHIDGQHPDTFVNVLRTLDSCRMDDYLVFGQNNVGTNFLGSRLCSASDPDSILFSWSIGNNGNSITFINANNAFADNNVTATITSLSSSALSMKYTQIYKYIDTPYSVNAQPMFHDTTWTYDTVLYKVTYNTF